MVGAGEGLSNRFKDISLNGGGGDFSVGDIEEIV